MSSIKEKHHRSGKVSGFEFTAKIIAENAESAEIFVT
jgi:hypothetical protein